MNRFGCDVKWLWCGNLWFRCGAVFLDGSFLNLHGLLACGRAAECVSLVLCRGLAVAGVSAVTESEMVFGCGALFASAESMEALPFDVPRFASGRWVVAD